jgi:tRNA (guanine37-N1)-methyltransferase
MIFNIITIFPQMFDAIRNEGVIARAIKNDILTLNLYQLRDFSKNKYKNIDDAPYGGGGGMVMMVQPIRDCLAQIKQKNPDTTVIYLSPQGKKLTHNLAVELSQKQNLTLLCGRYEGVDQRVIEHDVDMELSIGDFVVSGGELPAMVAIDAISRQISGVLGNAASLQDSFVDDMLDYPHYTRPEIIDNQSVPEVLLSGNQAKIDAWRAEQAELATKTKLKN